MPGREQVLQAIRDNWTVETSADGEFVVENPAKGQCEVSSFVAWRYLGGDLVLSKVYLDGEEVEHHYWNRIDGQDLDITREQFTQGEDIEEIKVLPSDFLSQNMNAMRPEVLGRIQLLSDNVARKLGEEPPCP